MMKTAKVAKSIENTGAEAVPAVTHSLAFDKNQVSIDWDNDGNPVLVFDLYAPGVGIPEAVVTAISNWSDQLDLDMNELLEPLYAASLEAIMFSALKKMVLK